MHSDFPFSLPSDFAYMLGNHPKDGEDTERVLSVDAVRWLCSVQFSCSVVSVCDLMDCSMPGFPVHHQLLPELTQTHAHTNNGIEMQRR